MAKIHKLVEKKLIKRKLMEIKYLHDIIENLFVDANFYHFYERSKANYSNPEKIYFQLRPTDFRVLINVIFNRRVQHLVCISNFFKVSSLLIDNFRITTGGS